MKISVWQQFASNHSASFTIVGAFQDSDWAMQAVDVVRDAVKSMADWYATHPDIRQAVISGKQKEPTGAELEISQKFDIPAYRALDWLATCDYDDPRTISNLVYRYENLIFVTTRTWESCDGWAGPTLFDGLMMKFAQSVFIGAEDYSELLISLTWLAPDEQTAAYMGNLCRRFTRGPAIYNGRESPWIIPYLRDQPDGDALLRDYHIYLSAERAERTSRDYPTEPKDLISIEKLDSARKSQLETIFHEVVTALYDTEHSGISVEGRKVTVRGLRFYNTAIGLPAIIKWLKEQSCSDIKYQFEQIMLNG